MGKNLRIISFAKNSFFNKLHSKIVEYQDVHYSIDPTDDLPTKIYNIFCSFGITFMPTIYNNKLIVYFAHEKYLSKENCSITCDINSNDIKCLLSSINKTDIIEYNSALFFVVNKIFNNPHNHIRFAIEGNYEGNISYLTFENKICTIYSKPKE